MSRPLRVGIVTHYWLPHIGGIEVLAHDQANRLAEMGWSVTVFTSRLAGEQAETFDGAVRVRRFSCTNLLESRLSVPVPLVSPAMLRALLRAGSDLDLILAHGHIYIGSLYAALASRRLGVPLVVMQHSPFVHYGRLLDQIESLTDRTLGRAVLERAAKVISVSDFTMSFIESVAPRANVTRIYPGVALDKFNAARHLRDKERPLFVTVRRLVPRSGIDVLLRAWIDNGLGRCADLAIAGDGALKTALTRMVGSDPSIRFLGRLSDDDLPKFYAEADVFVLPTVSGEGYGLALAEALASGLPAIVTNDGAPRELVEHRVTGLVVSPGDASMLAEHMMLLATDGNLRTTLTKNVLAGRGSLDRAESVAMVDTELRQVIGSSRVNRAFHDRAGYPRVPRWIRPLLGFTNKSERGDHQ